MAGATRLELAAFCVTGRRSNQTELRPQRCSVCECLCKEPKKPFFVKQIFSIYAPSYWVLISISIYPYYLETIKSHRKLQIRSPKIANAKTYTYPRIQLLPYVIRICILHISLRVYSLDSGADNSNYHLDKIVSNLQVLVIKTGKFTKTMSIGLLQMLFGYSFVSSTYLFCPLIAICNYRWLFILTHLKARVAPGISWLLLILFHQ